MIAGKGEEFDRYEQMMVNRERFIIHNDYIPVQQRDEYFKRASIIVLPYIDATISGVIPVAYTFGKPVIATTVGILPEMVDHGETGLLVEPKNETALADAVVQLLEDPARRHRMGAQARKKIETDLSPDTLARQTIEVYEHTRHPVHATS
jgi:glycosyltransferase involved in cell wall biosynthesis